jgi:hypothetical protein
MQRLEDGQDGLCVYEWQIIEISIFSDKPRTKARRRVAMFPNPEMVLLAAVVGEVTA